MIITLTKADFSLCKIGTLTTFNVRKSTVIGASVNIIKTSVERAGYSSATTIATIVLDEANYEGHAIKVMMGSTDVSSWYSVGKVIVPAKTPITSNITISVSATAVSGGDPIIPDVPVTPTMYTFTINPMVANATVTLTASGYKQSGNSISVPSGTTVSWTVSAGGYFDKNGSETVTKDKTLNVDLGKIPDPGTGGASGESYWLLESIKGMTDDVITQSSFLGSQSFNYTTQDIIDGLSGKTITDVKFVLPKERSGKPTSTTAGKLTLYLIAPGSPLPSQWTVAATINVGVIPFSEKMKYLTLETPIEVPAGYNIGWTSSNTNMLGCSSKKEGVNAQYYDNAQDTEATKLANTYMLDFKVK